MYNHNHNHITTITITIINKFLETINKFFDTTMWTVQTTTCRYSYCINDMKCRCLLYQMRCRYLLYH